MRRSLLRACLLPAAALLIGVAGYLLLSTRAGRAVLGTVPVGQHPTLVAVDELTRRAFVLNGGSYARDSNGGIVAGTISVLDTRTGAVIRTDPAGTAPQAIGIDEQTDRVFVVNSAEQGGAQGGVTVLDAHSGRVLRVVRLGGSPEAAVVDARTHRVYVLVQGPMCLSVLDASSGRLLGTLALRSDFGQEPDTYTLAADTSRGRLFASLAAPASAFRMFDLQHGVLPRAILVGRSSGELVVDEQTGRVFIFGITGGEVRATATGRLVRRIALGPNLNVAGAVADQRTGRVFVSSISFGGNGAETNGGSVYVLDGRSGAVLHTTRVGRPGALAVDERTGHVLVTNAGPHDLNGTYEGTGSAAVLDGHSGALIETVPVGVGPLSVAIDGRSGRAFVVNYGGMVFVPDRWSWLPGWLRQRLPFFAAPASSTRAVSGSVSVIALPR